MKGNNKKNKGKSAREENYYSGLSSRVRSGEDVDLRSLWVREERGNLVNNSIIGVVAGRRWWQWWRRRWWCVPHNELDDVICIAGFRGWCLHSGVDGAFRFAKFGTERRRIEGWFCWKEEGEGWRTGLKLESDNETVRDRWGHPIMSDVFCFSVLLRMKMESELCLFYPINFFTVSLIIMTVFFGQ